MKESGPMVSFILKIFQEGPSNSTEVPNHYMYMRINVYIYI